MSILIKGMEMPKKDELIIISSNGDVEKVKCDGTTWLYDSKAIEIPPHGRLIDADALLKSISLAIEDDSDIADVYEEDYESVNDWLASAPTIIEAEGE